VSRPPAETVAPLIDPFTPITAIPPLLIIVALATPPDSTVCTHVLSTMVPIALEPVTSCVPPPLMVVPIVMPPLTTCDPPLLTIVVLIAKPLLATYSVPPLRVVPLAVP
jgi:hypothetical protein